MTKRSLKTVNRIQAYRNEGRIDYAPHRRRPRATTDDEDRQLVAAVAVDHFESARKVGDDARIDVSTRKVQGRYAETRLSSRIAARKPLLSEPYKQDRLRFSRDHEA